MLCCVVYFSVSCLHQTRIDQLKREVIERQCVEEKLVTIIKLLSEPLEMLGCNPPPLALPDILVHSHIVTVTNRTSYH